MAKVTIYSTPVCVYCKMTKEFFAKNNIKYDEFNVASDLKAREEMVGKSHQLAFPSLIMMVRSSLGLIKRSSRRRLA